MPQKVSVKYWCLNVMILNTCISSMNNSYLHKGFESVPPAVTANDTLQQIGLDDYIPTCIGDYLLITRIEH